MPCTNNGAQNTLPVIMLCYVKHRYQIVELLWRDVRKARIRSNYSIDRQQFAARFTLNGAVDDRYN